MGDRLTRLHSPGYAYAYPGFLIRVANAVRTRKIIIPEKAFKLIAQQGCLNPR